MPQKYCDEMIKCLSSPAYPSIQRRMLLSVLQRVRKKVAIKSGLVQRVIHAKGLKMARRQVQNVLFLTLQHIRLPSCSMGTA